MNTKPQTDMMTDLKS